MEKPKEKKIYIDFDNIPSIIKNLSQCESNVKFMKNLDNILSKENLDFFNSLIEKDNIKINLLLSKIFTNIISNDFLYKTYIPSITESGNNKIEIILELINNIVLVVEKLDTFIFSFELFNLKRKTLSLLNHLYNNCHSKLNDGNEKISKIIELMDGLPLKFFSKAFNEMIESPDIFELLISQNPYNINLFEDKFSEMINCFEQNEIFKKFVELNTDLKDKIKTKNEEIEIKRFDKTDDEKIDFYEKYGTLLMKFCSYHYYIFLDEKKEDLKEKGEIEEDNQPVKVIFLINKKQIEKTKEKEDEKKRIESLLSGKKFKSILGSKEYCNLMRRLICYYLNEIKTIKILPKLKEINDNLIYFLDSLETDSYYPLFLKKLDKMIIIDNFTQSYLTNILPGEIKKYYFETNFNEDVLIYIEFYLEDKNTDINFELNQYNNNTNLFQTIYKQTKVEETIRFFIYCHGYSIYEIVFDNYYSWFTSKDVNFRLSILIPIKDKFNEDSYETEDYFIVNGNKYCYESKQENEEDSINVPIIVNMNNLSIVNIKKNEKEGKKYEIEFKENKEEEDIISKLYLNYILFNHFKKQKFDKKKPVLLSIYSLNNDLLKIKEDLKETIKNFETEDDKKFIRYLGFFPDKTIADFNITYKLFDINEQLIINHKLLNYKKRKEKEKEKKEEKDNIKDKNKNKENIEKEDNTKENKKEKEISEQKIEIKSGVIEDEVKDIKINKNYQSYINPILIIHLNKKSNNILLFDKGKFYSNYKISDSKEISFCDCDINKEVELFNLINNMGKSLIKFEIILTYDSKKEEEDRKDLINLKEKIIQYCKEKTDFIINVFEYDINETCINIIKYYLYKK